MQLLLADDGTRREIGVGVDRDAAMHHRHPQHAAEAMHPRDFPDRCMQYLFSVGDRERLATLGQLERRELFDGRWEIRPERFVGRRSGWRERGEVDDAVDIA